MVMFITMVAACLARVVIWNLWIPWVVLFIMVYDTIEGLYISATNEKYCPRRLATLPCGTLYWSHHVYLGIWAWEALCLWGGQHGECATSWVIAQFNYHIFDESAQSMHFLLQLQWWNTSSLAPLPPKHQVPSQSCCIYHSKLLQNFNGPLWQELQIF